MAVLPIRRPRAGVTGAVILIAAMASAAPSAAQPWVARSGAASELGWLTELAGHCWRSANNRQCFSLQFERYLRATVEPGPAGDSGVARAPNRGDAVIAWDEVLGAVSFIYWSSWGPFGLSEGRLQGDEFAVYDPLEVDPKAPATRYVWSRPREAAYTVRIQKLSNGRWADTQTVVYRRDD
jgi:hypothetical protein